MLEYLFALIAVAVVAYFLKVKLEAKPVLIAFLLFVFASFIWGSIANNFGLQPSDLMTNLLYSLVGFTIFWILWLKWGRKAARD